MGPKVILLLAALALAGCNTTKPAPIADPKAVWCEENEPTRYTPAERAVLATEVKADALAHNLKGADWCGWKP